MRVLWVVNFIFPDVADELKIPRNISGGWLLDLSKQLASRENIDLTIVSMFQGSDLKKYDINGIKYYLIPGGGKKAQFYSKSLVKYWEIIDTEVQPDIVHLHGTEFTHGEVYLDNFKQRKFLLTLQGMLGPISREATAYIPLRVKLFGSTFKELLHFNGMLNVQMLFKKNSRHEKSIIKKVNYVTGRTFWDECLAKSINPAARYFRCFFNLRESFYTSDKWNVETCERNRIYGGTAAQLSYKGGHILVQAFNEVLKEIPDAKLVLILYLDKDGNPIPKNGYQKYILRLINYLGIRESIEFLPPQNEANVVAQMLKANCMVVASSMENASSTLREGMHLGIPCIASYRGGMTYLINDGTDGYFYDFPEYEYLSGRICQILKDDDLASEFSRNAIAKAEIWHNREKNTNDYIDIYHKIYEEQI